MIGTALAVEGVFRRRIPPPLLRRLDVGIEP